MPGAGRASWLALSARTPAEYCAAMHMWSDALDDLNELAANGGLTIDQRLKVAEIKALLAIGQELSIIHHEGINSEYSHD